MNELKNLLKESFDLFVKKRWLKAINKEVNKYILSLSARTLSYRVHIPVLIFVFSCMNSLRVLFFHSYRAFLFFPTKEGDPLAMIFHFFLNTFSFFPPNLLVSIYSKKRKYITRPEALN
jgi:hypothetical protein